MAPSSPAKKQLFELSKLKFIWSFRYSISLNALQQNHYILGRGLNYLVGICWITYKGQSVTASANRSIFFVTIHISQKFWCALLTILLYEADPGPMATIELREKPRLNLT